MSRDESDRFVEVVPAASSKEADALFGAWLTESKLAREEIADDDIRIDTVRMLDGGTGRRYLVREHLITGRE